MPAFSCIKRILTITLFIPLVVFGQASLKGTVTDGTTDETLIGVNVIIQGTSLGASTDIEGQFRIVGIPARIFNIKISYVGYEPKILEIDFSKTQDVSTNVQLKPAVIEGEEVVVTAQMRGQIAAINQQITSKTIMNVVSEEKIQELPDANAAEAIGRLPGVSIIRSGGEATNVVMRGMSSKFSNITVDGVKVPPTNANTRDVDLSMMSQGALAGIELYKTLTPDQDADAIAGTVNLVTRKAPADRLIRFDIKGDYNNLMKSAKQYDFSGRYGERFFGDMIGLQVQANAEKKIRSREQSTTGYLESKTPDYAISHAESPFNNDYNIVNFTVNFTDELRSRAGGQVIIDVNTPDSGSVKLSGLYSSTTTNISTYNRIYPAPGSTNTCDYNLQYQEFGISTINASLQGKNHLLGLDADWNLSYAHSKGTNPYDFLMTFQESPGMIGTPQPSKGDPENTIVPYAVNNYTAATCSTSVFNKQENFDKEVTAFLNLSQKYTATNLLSGEVKGGAKYKKRSRWMDQSQLDDNNQLHTLYNEGVDVSAMNQSRFSNYWNNHNTTLLLSDFVDMPVISRDLFDKDRMAPIINMDGLREWYALMKNAHLGATPEFSSSAAAALNAYTTTENIYSGFIMNTLNIGQSITFISGLRVEQEKNYYGAHYSTNLSVIGLIVNGTVKDTVSSFSETIWLPNAQLVMRPTDYLTVRLAGYRALARPDYNLRLPIFSQTNGSPTPFTLGNTNLRNTKAWNFEVNTQVFNNSIGLISVSAFYKKIDDLYHQMTNIRVSTQNDSLLNALGITWQTVEPFKTLLHNNSNDAFTLAYNSPGPSYAWGFELEHQTNFGFIKNSLSNITLSYNVSVTRSETEIIISKTFQPYVFTNSGTPAAPVWSWTTGVPYNQPLKVKRRSENQPEFYGNLSLGYDIGDFSARVSMFYQGEYVQTYSFDGTNDTRQRSFTKWDLAFKEQATKSIALFLNIDNLTSVVETTTRTNTVMDWSLDRTRQQYGMTVDLGVRVSI